MTYDRDARYGIHHWPPKRALFYRSSRLQITPGNVAHDHKIVSIQFVATDSMWGYDFVKQITAKRLDEKEYVFSEADFHRLPLNDIEDMYLLKIQGKLCNLPREMQLRFITALLIFIRSVIIKERVEDLQLGVESYQKQLNLTAPNLTDVPNIDKLSQYTLIKQPAFGFIYRSVHGSNRFMAFDEIHKFCDETLKFVHDGLKTRLAVQMLGKAHRWNTDETRQVRRFMAQIEHRLKRRDQIRRLESYVGGRPVFPILTF